MLVLASIFTMIGSGEQLKVELKQWEREFIKEYRRKPTKNDICARKDICKNILPLKCINISNK